MTQRVDRRTYLQVLSAGGVASLAGCLGDDDGDGGDADGDDGTDDGTGDSDGGEDLGEAVPLQLVEVIAGTPASQAWEQASGYLVEVLNDLGVESDVSVREAITMWSETWNDNRSQNYHFDNLIPTPAASDPESFLRDYSIVKAGANGRSSMSQYASCEYSTLVEEASSAPSLEERRDIIHEAFAVASEDIVNIPTHNGQSTSAIRTDEIDYSNVGTQGATYNNIEFLVHSEPIEGDRKVVNVPGGIMRSKNYLLEIGVEPWRLVYSGLVKWDEDYNIVEDLATNVEIQDEATTYTFELRENATFQNGDPITPEDVKWSYEYIENNTDMFPRADPQGYSSIEVVDDNTVEFNFEEPNHMFYTVHLPMFGVYPRDIWIEAGAEEAPDEVDFDPIVGSGPYRVTGFETESLLTMEPYEDHWNAPTGNLVFQSFRDTSAAQLAFEEGELNMFLSTSEGSNTYLQENVENAEIIRVKGISGHHFIMPQHSFGTSKFREFRHALSQAIDRELLVEMIAEGHGEIMTESSLVPPAHPYYPEDGEGIIEIADDTTGDLERARGILEDAGWAWDDDGNLHYPPGAETELWPKGDTPADHPDEFPCVEELINN